MGLSASQTRYLSLTARKSNVEYQGQQINQARTTLANQSAELYTEMMTLKAPVAPSPYQYVIDPAQCPAIDWEMADAWPLSDSALKEFSIYYAGNQPSFASFNIPEYEKQINEFTNEVTFHKVSYNKDGVRQVGAEGFTEAQMADKTYWYSEIGYNIGKEKVKYAAIHTSEDDACSYKYNYTTGLFEVSSELYKDIDFPDNIKAFNFAASQYNTYSKPTRSAVYESVEVATNAKDTEDPKKFACAQKASATMSINQAQYDAAMVQYEQDLKEYEEHLDIINKKSEEIHESDKKLELQLKQLDTEQEAIQTEYEAVKKVIEKNIENTFKTFG